MKGTKVYWLAAAGAALIFSASVGVVGAFVTGHVALAAAVSIALAIASLILLALIQRPRAAKRLEAILFGHPWAIAAGGGFLITIVLFAVGVRTYGWIESLALALGVGAVGSLLFRLVLEIANRWARYLTGQFKQDPGKSAGDFARRPES